MLQFLKTLKLCMKLVPKQYIKVFTSKLTLHKKMKFSIKDFFSKCDYIHSFLRIWPHLLKKPLMQNFIFCAVLFAIIWIVIYLSFFKIYLQSFRKIFSTTGTSHWMTDSSLNWIRGATFAGKCPWFVYMICLTYCFPFFSFSLIAMFFDVASCIFKLKDFICSNSFLPPSLH